MNKQKPSLDPTLEKYYLEGNERDRLAICQIEKDRTLKILKKSLPASPAIVFDVGGAAGAYAFPLAEQGYEVHLLDPIPLHIKLRNMQRSLLLIWPLMKLEMLEKLKGQTVLPM